MPLMSHVFPTEALMFCTHAAITRPLHDTLVVVSEYLYTFPTWILIFCDIIVQNHEIHVVDATHHDMEVFACFVHHESVSNVPFVMSSVPRVSHLLLSNISHTGCSTAVTG